MAAGSLGEAVIDGLFDERVIRDFAVAHDVFKACELIWKNRREQILGFHAL